MKLTDQDIIKLTNLAQIAAKKAGLYIQQNANNKLQIQLKENARSEASAVVTEIDIQSQKIILDVLSASIAQYDLGLLTEEMKDDSSRFTKDYFWCIDPLDGTLAYTEGTNGYAVSIALVSKDGVSVLGVIYDPVNDEHFFSNEYEATNFNNQRLKPSELVCFFDRSFLKDPSYELIIQKLNRITKQLQLERLVIKIGQGAVKSALGVLQHKNAMYFKFPKSNHGGGSLWDFAATACLFNQSKFPHSDFRGNIINYNHSSIFLNHCGVIFTSNIHLHHECLQLYPGDR